MRVQTSNVLGAHSTGQSCHRPSGLFRGWSSRHEGTIARVYRECCGESGVAIDENTVAPAADSSSVQQWQQLQAMRQQSLERSHETRNNTKRRGQRWIWILPASTPQHELQQQQEQDEQQRENQRQKRG
jgi:hypothetical protein